VKLPGSVVGAESQKNKIVQRLPCFCSWGRYLKPVAALPFLDPTTISSDQFLCAARHIKWPLSDACVARIKICVAAFFFPLLLFPFFMLVL